jgi:hypothetical protein
MGRLKHRFITGDFNGLGFSLVMNFSLVGVDFGVGVLGHERITNFFVGLALLILASFGRVVRLFGIIYSELRMIDCQLNHPNTAFYNPIPHPIRTEYIMFLMIFLS